MNPGVNERRGGWMPSENIRLELRRNFATGFDAVRDRLLFDVKADFGFGRCGRRSHELTDGFKEGLDVGIVTFDLPLKLRQLAI
jgi:hypothetical protein